ncbi:MAG TPA: hypothetical protein VD930_01430, partial [Gemmatimonadales bacterium]|nr:hypothetical protein [Gemmatimonadales bacterium]
MNPSRVDCRRLIAAVICFILACQNSPTDSGGPPDGTEADSLRITVPSTLLVNDVALLTAKLWKDGQHTFESPVNWSSSDPSIASLTPSGTSSAVVTGGRRGTVTISASSGGIVTEATLRITAELSIQPDYVLATPEGWPMAVGDQLQLEAVYVDVDGEPIAEIPSLTWSSTPAA